MNANMLKEQNRGAMFKDTTPQARKDTAMRSIVVKRNDVKPPVDEQTQKKETDIQKSKPVFLNFLMRKLGWF
jgi:hypothetical protein